MKNSHLEKYRDVKLLYNSLGENLKQVIEVLIEEQKISYLSISYRIKEEESFIEKIDRKKYSNPFEEIEDICGIRIICYYKTDVDKIGGIISSEFNVLESQDKEDLLAADQFGYRSTHFIVKIEDSWAEIPNYRKLNGLKCEIQVRTVLMHSWAEIQHKLAYKKESFIPEEIKRKLFRISAKLEEADEQFEEIKSKIQKYRKEIEEKIRESNESEKEIILNLDSLHATLNSLFPNRRGSINATTGLLEDFKKFNISINDFLNYYEKVKDYLGEYEAEEFKDSKLPKWYQEGVSRVILHLFNDDFLEWQNPPDETKNLVYKWRNKLKIKPIANKD